MTAQGILGEVLPEGRRLCTASTDVWLNGDSVDAGTAMILDSNLSQQSRESMHHLGDALGPGDVYANVGSYANLLDRYAQVNAPSPLLEVSWAQRTSMCFGPFDLTGDLRTTDGNVLRKIRVSIDCNKGASNSLTCYVAATQGPGIPLPDTQIGSTSAVLAGTGRVQTQLTMAINPIRPSTRRCSQGPVEFGPYADLFVWVAWRSTDVSDAIYSVSVWEVR